MRNIHVIPIPNATKRASSIWNNYQTHTRVRNWWKKFKNYECNLFSSKNVRKIWGKRQQLSQHQICCQNIRHHKFPSKHQIWCYNIRSGNTACHSGAKKHTLQYAHAAVRLFYKCSGWMDELTQQFQIHILKYKVTIHFWKHPTPTLSHVKQAHQTKNPPVSNSRENVTYPVIS